LLLGERRAEPSPRRRRRRRVRGAARRDASRCPLRRSRVRAPTHPPSVP